MRAEYLRILKGARLMQGLSEQEIELSLGCLKGRIMEYGKGQAIFLEGDRVEYMGVVLKGEVHIQKLDYFGNANIITRLSAGDLLAGAVVYSSSKLLPFDVISVSASVILCLDMDALSGQCNKACGFHAQIIRNLLSAIADRNLVLNNKIDILTKRTIRQKVLAFLHSESKRHKSERFELSVNRRQMADYLSVDRSALSRELSELRKEGVIDFDEKTFRIGGIYGA